MIIDVFSYLPTAVHMRYMLNTFAATPDYLYTVFGKTIAQVSGVSPEEKFVQDLERMGVASIIVRGEDNETTLGLTPIPNDDWAEVMRDSVDDHRVPRYFTRPGAGWEPLLHFGNSTIQEKVMFGSAWFLMGRSIEELAQDVRDLPLKPEVVQKWLSGNAKRVFELA